MVQPADRRPGTVTRQLVILALAFLGGTAIAALLGAIDLGTALGVGQVCFAAALVWLLLR
jgi:hypothetical protein